MKLPVALEEPISEAEIASGRALRFEIFLLVIATLGTILRFLLGFFQNPLSSLFGPMKDLWLQASPDQFLSPTSFLQGLEPVGPQFYLLLLRMLSRDDIQTIATVTGILSALMPWLYYLAARKFGLDRTVAALVVVLIAWNPGLIVPYFYFTPESLALFLVGAATLATASYFETKSGQSFLLASLVWTAAALCHPLAAPLGIIVLGLAWWLNSRKADMLILGVVAAGILLVPNMLRTWSILGFPAPLGSNWVNVLQHKAPTNAIQVEFTPKSGGVETILFPSPNLAYAHGTLRPFRDWPAAPTETATASIIKIQRSNGEADWVRASRSFPITKESFVAGWVRNVIFITIGPSYPEPFQANDFTGNAVNLARWLWAPLIGLCSLLALISVALGCRHPLAILGLAIGFILLTQTGGLSDGQYRKPAEPLILLSLTWLLVNRPWRVVAPLPASTERKVQRISAV